MLFYDILTQENKQVARVAIDQCSLLHCLAKHGCIIGQCGAETIDRFIDRDAFTYAYFNASGRIIAFSNKEYHVAMEVILRHEACIDYYVAMV